MNKFPCFYYLHTNGSVIYKPKIVVDYDPDYFVSDFVQQVWCVHDIDEVIELCNVLLNLTNVDEVNKVRKEWNV